MQLQPFFYFSFDFNTLDSLFVWNSQGQAAPRRHLRITHFKKVTIPQPGWRGQAAPRQGYRVIVNRPYDKSYRSFQPLGIIFAIMPWNFPFWQVMRYAIPNLMLGNACLLKHAPNTTGCGLFIEKLFLNAGFPKNLFRSIVIDVSLTPFIIHHPLIAGVTFTGSNRIGKAVAGEAGTALKKIVLELGGSDPYIILDDADLELAAEQCVLSRLSNAGQVCIAAKRIIVLESIRDDFEALVLQKTQKYTMGNTMDPKTILGPLAHKVFFFANVLFICKIKNLILLF